MSLNWLWKNNFGRMIDKDGNSHFLYSCNGLIVSISEWTNEEGEEVYSLYDFRANEQHEKNCVADGIKMFEGTNVEIDIDKIKTLYSKRELKFLMGMMLEADEVILKKGFKKEVESYKVQNERMKSR